MRLLLPPLRDRATSRPLLVVTALVLLTGCPAAQPDAPEPDSALPLAGTELRLTIVDDPAIAKSAERLRGEWNSQTGGQFSVVEATSAELLNASSPPGDAVILPSALLGPLAEREWVGAISPPRPSGIANNERADASSAVFESIRRNEAVWGADTAAISFGSPVFICYYRADLLEQLEREPPQTWDEYLILARLLAGATPGVESWHGTIEPLGPGWAGLVLLARAAPYAKHWENYSVWFDIRTMEPLIAGPPFVRALEELVEAAKLGPSELLDFDPAAVRRAFWSGRAGLALSWPTAAAEALPVDAGAGFRTGFVELPGSATVYNVGRKRWDQRADGESRHVPLLAIAGRLGVVTRGSPRTGAAEELLAWLAGPDWSLAVCTRSPVTTLFRREHLAAPAAWVEAPLSSDAAAQYAGVTEATLSRRNSVTALRIPGREDYLAALDQAVHAAVRGEAAPQDALNSAAASWRATTDALGLERQKTAYRRSLGL